MRRVGPLGLLLVIWLGARPTMAQQVAYAATPVTELDSATQAALAREIAHARERGIPIEPLVAKVREGRLKRAAGLRIRSAVTALAERLDSARAALGPESSSEELIAGADALQAHAGESSLRALRAATTRPIAAPLGTLAQLVASGVKPARAVELIVDLLRHNATPAQVLALGHLVETDVASGLRADESATIRLRGIEGSLGTGSEAVVTAAPTPPGGTPPRPAAKPTRRP